MLIKSKIYLLIFICILASGCATGPLQAPCDAHAHFCGAKTKISQW